MTTYNTSRRGLNAPNGDDDIANGDNQLRSLVGLLDGDARIRRGTLISRGASAFGGSLLPGDIYMVTNYHNLVSVWDGSVWVPLHSSVYATVTDTFSSATVVSPIAAMVVEHTGRLALVTMQIEATSDHFPYITLTSGGIQLGQLKVGSTISQPQALTVPVRTTEATMYHTVTLDGTGNFLGSVTLTVAEV